MTIASERQEKRSNPMTLAEQLIAAAWRDILWNLRLMNEPNGDGDFRTEVMRANLVAANAKLTLAQTAVALNQFERKSNHKREGGRQARSLSS